MNITKKLLLGLGGMASISLLASSVLSCSSTPKDELLNKELKVATFNLSLAVDGTPNTLKWKDTDSSDDKLFGAQDGSDTYKRWEKYFSIEPKMQEELVNKWLTWREKINKTTPPPAKGEVGYLSKKDQVLAERIIQIRNVAAIIQKTRPEILLLNEFNSDGKGNEKELDNFKKNYLEIGQYSEGTFKGQKLEPIKYPYSKTYATNTGLQDDLDLANDGIKANQPEDAYGFGFYHGHYGMALLSMHEIDHKNTRTFQKFLWKDMPGAENPRIQWENKSKFKEVNERGLNLPKGMRKGQKWFSDEEWDKLRLSSKNHVDAPIIVKENGKKRVIHLLLSHPTPAGFEFCAPVNTLRNKAEVEFWDYYLDGASFVYDDDDKKGGLDKNVSFVILGDQNADPLNRTESRNSEGILNLLTNKRVNQGFHSTEDSEGKLTDGKYLPISNGGKQFVPKGLANGQHPDPKQMTAVFKSRADYALPSANLEIINQGVFWPGKNDDGTKQENWNLFFDSHLDKVMATAESFYYQPTIGYNGDSKTVSSDHRLVWVTIKI